MKKFLFWFLGILAFLILAVWGWLGYRQARAIRLPVHQQADALLRINIDALAREILWNSLTHPESSGKDTTREKKKSEAWWRGTGLTIPGSLFFSEIRRENAAGWYTLIPAEDTGAFHSWVTKRFKMSWEKQPNGFYFARNKQNTLAMATSSGNALVAFSFQGGIDTATITEMLSGKNLTPARSSVYFMERTSGPISLMTEAGVLSVRSDAEQLLFDMDLKEPVPVGLPQGSLPTTTGFLFQLNGQKKNWFMGSRFEVAGHTMETDSIAQWFQGQVMIFTGDNVLQKDSVITYDYDDNFEKVEVVKMEEKQVPELTIRLDGDANAMAGYLKKQGFITSENRLNPEVFPPIQLMAVADSDHLTLTNSDAAMQPVSPTNTGNDWLYSELQPGAFIEYVPASIANKYLRPVTRFRVQGSTKNNKSTLHGEILFSKKGINAFRQLAKVF